MFAADHDKPASLRQGDIVADVFFPLTRPALLRYLAVYVSGSDTAIELAPFVDVPQGSRKSYVQSISHGVVAHGAVISQCCDLDKKHPKASFSLCRLIPIDRRRYRNVDALINNIDPWGPENPHFQFFYFGQIDGLNGEFAGDFGLLTSVPWADYDAILGKKTQQLDDENRNKFRVKVGAFFGRPTQDDVDAGLANPYKPIVAQKPSWFLRARALLRR